MFSTGFSGVISPPQMDIERAEKIVNAALILGVKGTREIEAAAWVLAKAWVDRAEQELAETVIELPKEIA